MGNPDVMIIGDKVTLVPYEREHVAQYFAWMQDPWLLEMTASEALPIEEEHEMQQSWRVDPKKFMFIVLQKGDDDMKTSPASPDAVARMAGDVNLFFNDDEDATNCEIDVMIAEARYRRTGFGREAIQLMMAYGNTRLGVQRFFAKIHQTNEASLRLFKSLGFQQCNYVAAFEEYELEWLAGDHADWAHQVLTHATVHRIGSTSADA